MESPEHSNNSMSKTFKNEKEELSGTEYFEINTEIKIENIQQKNEPGKVFKCEFCRYKSKYKGSVTAHEKSIHMMQKFHCDLCGYKATEQSNLTRHKQSKHEGIKYSCSKCEKQFPWKRDLRKHIQSVHDGKKY